MIVRELPGGVVVCTDRSEGVSAAPYEHANLADHVGDRAHDVASNRERLADALRHQIGVDVASPESWAWLRQVHGANVEVFDAPRSALPDADAAVTTRAAIPLVVLVADCAPIALVAGDAVGIVHAGWRGVEAGVVRAAVDAVRARTAGPIRAVLGPCIRPARYEFASADLTRLARTLGPHVVAETDDGRPAFDLPAAVRHALTAAGVEEIDDVAVCTASSSEHFSYRRDGRTGRQGMVVVRTGGRVP